jgi:hypothetical protein
MLSGRSCRKRSSCLSSKGAAPDPAVTGRHSPYQFNARLDRPKAPSRVIHRISAFEETFPAWEQAAAPSPRYRESLPALKMKEKNQEYQ